MGHYGNDWWVMGVCLPLSLPWISHHILRPPLSLYFAKWYVGLDVFALSLNINYLHMHMSGIWHWKVHLGSRRRGRTLVFRTPGYRRHYVIYLVKKFKLHYNIGVIRCSSLDKIYQNYCSFTAHSSRLTAHRSLNSYSFSLCPDNLILWSFGIKHKVINIQEYFTLWAYVVVSLRPPLLSRVLIQVEAWDWTRHFSLAFVTTN